MGNKYGKNGIPKKRRATGVVYILQITLNGHAVYKIGQTTRQVYERVAELSVDLYKWYGYFPRIDVLKSDRHKHYIEIEAELLKR